MQVVIEAIHLATKQYVKSWEQNEQPWIWFERASEK